MNKENLISDESTYKKENRLIEKALSNLKIETTEENKYGFEQLLNKITGGKVLNKEEIENTENEVIKKTKNFLLSEKMDEGRLSPINKAMAVIKMIENDMSVRSIKDQLKKAEAEKELKEKGKKNKKYEPGGGKGQGEEGECDMNEVDEICKPKWVDLLKVKKMLTTTKDKVGFVNREFKLVEGGCDETRRSFAKSIKDLQKASPELFAMPELTFAKKIVSNEYQIKRKYRREYKSAKIIILEDVSGSMRGKPWEWAAATTIAMLKEEQSGHIEIVDVWLFGDRKHVLNLNGNKVADYISKRNHKFPGSTERQETIVEAANLLKEQGDGEIIILTDGAFDIPTERMKRIAKTGVKVNCLLIGEGVQNITTLCTITGGMFVNFNERE